MHPPSNEAARSIHASEDDLAQSQQWLERVGPTLFPSQCALAIQRYDSPDIVLPPPQDAALNRAVEKRQREFSAGRAAAAAALSRLDVSNAVIAVGENRNPLWPDGIAGSITHTAGLAVAVVARVIEISALGLDLEPVGAVKEELWASLFNQTEIAWLTTTPRAQRTQWATVIFCAKESFYKLQYPLTGQWVDFHEADVAVSIETGELMLTCVHPSVIEKLSRDRFAGRFASGPMFTLTAMHLGPPNKS